MIWPCLRLATVEQNIGAIKSLHFRFHLNVAALPLKMFCKSGESQFPARVVINYLARNATKRDGLDGHVFLSLLVSAATYTAAGISINLMRPCIDLNFIPSSFFLQFHHNNNLLLSYLIYLRNPFKNNTTDTCQHEGLHNASPGCWPGHRRSSRRDQQEGRGL